MNFVREGQIVTNRVFPALKDGKKQILECCADDDDLEENKSKLKTLVVCFDNITCQILLIGQQLL